MIQTPSPENSHHLATSHHNPTNSPPLPWKLSKICEATHNICAGKILSPPQSTSKTTTNPTPNPNPKPKSKIIIHPGKPNLTQSQLKILYSLRKNPDIIIKPADKGSATVILTTYAYKAEALRQLHNPKYYTILREPLYMQTAEKIYAILDELLEEK